MASPTPVPSKAALHALRGLIFGTSCSLVLLAEERRRRIGIARAAVENGRKLKSLKCYSSAATAALDNIREDKTADSKHLTWRPATRRESQTQDDSWLDEKFHSSVDVYTLRKLEPRPRTRRPRTNGQPETVHNCTPTDHNEDVNSGPARPPIRESRWAPRRESQQITQSLNKFLESSTPATIHHLRDLGINLRDEKRTLVSPDAALELVGRACNAVAESTVLPHWLCELSQHLCSACQNEGHHLTAARILSLLVVRGPITLEHYLAHSPKDLIRGLLRRSKMDKLVTESATERLRIARQIILVNVPDGAEYDWRSTRGVSDLARDIVERLILLGTPDEALSTLRQLHNVCVFGLGTYADFVRTFYGAGYHRQSLDAFMDLSKFGTGTQLSSGRLIYQMFHSLSETGGYAALEVLDTMRTLCVDSLEVPNVRNASLVLRDRWNKSRSLDQVDFLFKRILTIVGTDNKRVYSANTHALHSAMIEIQLKAGELRLAQQSWVQLRDRYHPACRDIKLQGSLALGHARHDRWDVTRSLLDDIHELRPFDQLEQEQHAETWRRIFVEYGTKHTWSELEEFIEGCVKTGRAPLLQETIDNIVQRLGMCRSYKRLRSWLRFCQSQDYIFDKAFWVSLFTTAREDWVYRTPQLVALYSEIQPCLRESAEYAGIRRAIEQLLARKAGTATTVYLRKPPQVSEEAMLFQKMRVDSQQKRWSEVLGAYRAAVDNGLEFSSRCLQLAVQSCLQTEGTGSAKHMLSQARAQGYDVGEASTPLDLAMLSHLEARLHSEHAFGSQVRPKAIGDINQIFRLIRDDGRSVEDVVFDRAAQVCLSVRNYREAIAICLKAAEANGGRDLCYSVFNFANLSEAFVAQHEYGKLRSLFKQMLQKHWRIGKLCRRSIETTISYLVVAAESDKEASLANADAEMIDYVEDVLRSIREDKANLEAQVDYVSDMASDSDTEQ